MDMQQPRPSYYCTICGIEYHIEIIEIFHSNERLCPICEKIFAGKEIVDGKFVDDELQKLYNELTGKYKPISFPGT